MLSSLFKSLPKPSSICGISLRPIIFLLGLLVSTIALTNSAWLWYTLAEWSSGLSTFRKIFNGLNAIFLILVVLLIIYGSYGLITRSEKKIRFFAHVAMFKFVILGILGLVNIISVAKGSNTFKKDCNKVYIDQISKCNTLQTTHIVLAVVLYIAEEVLLFLLAMLLQSHLFHMYDEHTVSSAQGYDKNHFTAGVQKDFESPSPVEYA
jgi:hypothetical protein